MSPLFNVQTQGKHALPQPLRTPVIHIRPYEPQDATQVQELFVRAISYDAGSPLAVALRMHLSSPESYVLYTLFSTGIVLTFLTYSPIWRAIGALLSIAASVVFWGYRMIMSDNFRKFCEASRSPQSDLANIGDHYRLRPVLPDQSQNRLATGHETSGPSGFWVAEVEGPQDDDEKQPEREIVGCIGLDSYFHSSPKSSELRRMAVSPHHKRLGIGTLLVRTAVAHAKKHGIEWVGLTVPDRFQPPARRLYERFGWVETRKKADGGWGGIARLHLVECRLDLTSCQ